jgi:hypothetical protein
VAQIVTPWLVDQGATFRRTLTYLDANQTPIDLTGYTAKLQVRRAAEDPDPALVTLTSGAGLTLGVDGTILIEFAPVQTAALDDGDAVFDMLLSAPDGTKTRLVSGRILVSPAVTR